MKPKAEIHRLGFDPHKLIVDGRREGETLTACWEQMRNSLEVLESAGRMLSGVSKNPKLPYVARRAARVLQLLREMSPGSFGVDARRVLDEVWQEISERPI